MSIFNMFRKTGAPQEGERVEPSAGGSVEPADAGTTPQGSAQDAPWVTVNPDTGEIGGAAVPPQASSTVSFGFGAEVKTPVDEAPAGVPSGTPGAEAGASDAAASTPSPSLAAPAFRPWNPYGGEAQSAQAAAPSAAAAVETQEASAAAVADLPEGTSASETSPNASEALESAAQPAGGQAAEPEPPAASASSGASSAFARSARAFEAPREETVETPIDKPVPREKAVAPQRTKKIVLEVPSDEELLARRRTRHRLVGAAALLMALVVAAPFVLDSEEDYETIETIETAIPPRPAADAPLEVDDPQESDAADAAVAEKPVKSEVVTTTIDPKPAKKPAEAEKAPAPKPAPKAEPAKSEAKPAQSAAPAEKPVKSVGIEPPTGEGFYIQVMATSSEREAEKVVKRLAMLGLPAYRMPVEKKATTLWRVRVGLYKTKKEAEGAVGTIVLNGVVQGQPIVGRQ